MTHAHHDVEIVERGDGGTGFTAGVMLAVAGLLAILIITLAVLWAHPWSSGSTHSSQPNGPTSGQDSGGQQPSSGGSDQAPAQ